MPREKLIQNRNKGMGYISGPLDPSFYLFLVVMMVRRVNLFPACAFRNFQSCARRLLVLYRPTCEPNKDALETILSTLGRSRTAGNFTF